MTTTSPLPGSRDGRARPTTTRAPARRRRPAPLLLEPLEDRRLPSATIQGTVFRDLNANGSRDAGEPSLAQAGITVYLDQNHDGVLDAGDASTTTAADGTYQFTGLAAGTYAVAQQAPAGWAQTSPAPTPGPGTLGQATWEVPAPEYLNAGLAWVNGSLYVEGYEAGNAIYQLDPATGAVLSHFNLPATAQANGLTFDGTNFWASDTNSPQVLQFNTTGAVLRQFASPGPSPTGIAWDAGSGTLWVADPTTNLVYDVSTTGAVLKSLALPESSVRGLVLANGQLWGTSQGSRRLFALDPSTGVEVQALPAPSAIADDNTPIALGFDGQSLWLSRIEGSQPPAFPTRLLKVTLSEPSEQAVTVADGASATADFGDFGLGTVSGQVYQDLNGNGAPDAGEPGLGGQRVYVDANGNGVFDLWERSALTDANGNYTLAGLPPGTYTVAQDLRPPGWVKTGPTSYTASITTSGQMVTGESFGNRQTGFGPVGPEFRANTTTAGTQEVGPQASAEGEAQSAAMDALGDFVVVWDGNGGGDGAGIFAQLYGAGGAPRGGEFRVDSATANPQQNAVVAMAPDGTFAVAWGTVDPSSNTSSVWARSFSASGAPLSGDIQVTAARSTQYGTSFIPTGIAMNSQDNFVVLYEGTKNGNGGLVYFQRYTSSGSTLGGATQVVDASLGNGMSSVGMDANGNLVVAWDDTVGAGGFAQRYSSSNKKVGSLIQLPFGGDPSVAMNATGTFVIAAHSDVSGVFPRAQIFSPSGAAQSPVLAFADLTNPPAGGAYTQSTSVHGRPGVAIDSAGNVMLTWGDGANVKARQYTSTGTALGDPFVVSTLPPGWVAWPSVAINGSGTAVVAWGGGGPGDDSGVFAQRFAAPAALTAAGAAPATAGTAPALTAQEVQPLVDEAIARWAEAGAGAAQLEALRATQVFVADLPGGELGLELGGTIWLDDNAAGWGWFVDPTPSDDSEFTTPGDQGEQARMDLLTALMHEMGHLLGYEHEASGVMQDSLTPGTRRLPSGEEPADAGPGADANGWALAPPSPALDRAFAAPTDWDVLTASLLLEAARRRGPADFVGVPKG